MYSSPRPVCVITFIKKRRRDREREREREIFLYNIPSFRERIEIFIIRNRSQQADPERV